METKIIKTDVFYRQVAGVKKVELTPGQCCCIGRGFTVNRWSGINSAASGTAPGTFGYMLFALKYHLEGTLEVISNGCDEYVVKFPDHKVYVAVNGNEEKLEMSRGESTLSGISESIVIAAIGAEALNLWNDPDLGPEMFCDAIYFGYTKNLAEIKDVEMSESDFNTLCNKVEFVQTSTNKAPQKSKPKTKKTTLEEWMDDVRTGKYVVEYDGWNDEEKDKIRPLSVLDRCEPTAELRRMVMIAHHFLCNARDRLTQGLAPLAENYVNFQLVGPPATGKSYLCEMVTAALGIPFDEMTLNPDQGVEVVEGETKIVDSELKFTPSVAGNALSKGISVLLDEFCQADANRSVSALNHILYAPFCYYENGYVKKERHPLSIVFSAYNTTEGIGNNIAASVKSRLCHVIPFKTQSDDLFVKLLDKTCPDETFDEFGGRERVINWVATAYKWAYNSLADKPHLREFITLRAAEGMLKEIACGIPPIETLPNIWAQLISEDEEEAHAMEQGICKVLPNL